MAKVWLITGSGNGLGREIAEAALAAGDSVVAGARRTEELAPLVAQYDERVKPVTLEVRYEAAAKAAVQLAVNTFGRLDVVVNNADTEITSQISASVDIGRVIPLAPFLHGPLGYLGNLLPPSARRFLKSHQGSLPRTREIAG